MPGPQIPFNNQFASPYALPQPQIPSIKGLRNVLRQELGVKPGSPIDTGLEGVDAAIPSLPSGSDIWHSLADAPPQVPYAGAKMGPFAPPAALGGLNQAGPNPRVDPLAAPQNDPLKGGSMSFGGGASPNLRQSGALDNFSALSKQFSQPRSVSTEELYRAKYADPDSRMPGAAAWANDQLGEIPGTMESLNIEKMRQPVDIASIGAEGGIRQQQIATQGQRDVADKYTNQSGQFNELLNQLTPEQRQQLSGVTLPGRNGGGSVRFSSGQNNLNPLLNQVTNMRYAAEQTIGRKWSWDGPSPEERALRQSIENVMLQDRMTPPEVKDTVRQVLSDPSLAALSNEQIIAGADNDDGTPLTPIQQQKLMEYLSAFR